jgi:PEP-CTERM motif
MTIVKSAVLALAVLGAAVPASAFTQIMSPGPTYTSATNLLGVPNPNGPSVFAVGDLELMVTFSSALDTREVGVDWSTWGSPPDTEDAAPLIFYTAGATSVEFNFDQTLTLWGFEAEPNPFDDRDFTVDYYDGVTLVGSISRTINGNAGARLLAAFHAPGFNRVVVSTDTDFAMAQLRYVVAIPEPATWAMLIAGFGMVGFAARRRNRIASLSN